MLLVRVNGRKRLLSRAVLERTALTTGVAAFFVAGYFGVGWAGNPARAHELTTPLDERIPFIASSVWVYLWIFPSALIPLFVVKCPHLFRRIAIAYATTIGISLIFFATFPITSVRLRVPAATLDLSHLSPWAISVIYRLDPPYNLFPSLHLSIAILAAFSVWKVARLYGAAIFVSMALVGVSVCTVKQHYLLDVLGGLVLSSLTGLLIIGRYHPPRGVSPGYSWLGPTSYVVFLVAVYASFFVAYLVK